MASGTSNSVKSQFKPLSWWIPKLSIMDRYLVSELLPPFLFGMGIFSAVLVAGGALFDLIRQAVDKGLPLNIVFQVLLLKIPEFIVWALPMSTLLAALMAYSRLSSDSELVALRGCGVSVYRLVIPAVIFSLIVTGITFGLREAVLPTTNYQATLILETALNRRKPAFRQRNILYPEYAQGPDGKVLRRLFYAEQYDGEKMMGLTVVDREEEELTQIVVSESAIWNPDENTWDFFRGTIYAVAPDSSYRNILRFEHQQLALPRTPLDLAEKGRDFGEMNIAQTREQLRLVTLSGDVKKMRKYQVRLNQRYSVPFFCFSFGLVGAALGNRPRRSSRATSFGVSVFVVFAFYSLFILSDALGQIGVLSPVMAAWTPIIFGVGAGGLLLIRAAR